ncbi:endolytic peptidoglycan transglycosylase RlpA, partial [Salmonella enterica subsp. enterica serovar Typhimurium]|nr:endolytic peptidoglycan transglycosylase RlpA [Salmonella enterica subsp. enterica serovar Typhimurium]MBJ4545235.1 endolytic peptidoglycan transglycosylase RlpA [Salmonella enterica subsp. enterica serovar Typhimurium]MBJ6065618.1 endolytic peptidoglycan transglycosylase RlpA [Salmonella enterica subsp. enterica serovar Derby]
TTVAKQTYALPPRPDLSGGMGSASSAPAQPQGDVLPVSNSTLKSDDTTGAPVSSSGFLGAPTTLAPGVLESNEPTPAPQPAPVSAPVAAPATAPATATPVSAPAAAAPVSAPVSAPAAAASGRFVVQVGAVSDQTRAQQYQQRLSQQFSVPGRVIQNGAVWRIQLGPFASKAEASAL